MCVDVEHLVKAPSRNVKRTFQEIMTTKLSLELVNFDSLKN